MTSTFDMSLKELKRHFIKAQKKVWRLQRKIDKSQYTGTYDPYGTLRSQREDLQRWKRWGINTAYELKRREVYLIDPGKHNQTNI